MIGNPVEIGIQPIHLEHGLVHRVPMHQVTAHHQRAINIEEVGVRFDCGADGWFKDGFTQRLLSGGGLVVFIIRTLRSTVGLLRAFLPASYIKLLIEEDTPANKDKSGAVTLGWTGPLVLQWV